MLGSPGLRFLIALALLFSVTPGMSEVVEAAAHLVGHGDLPHHEEPEVPGGACDEHNCTSLAHHCGCHASMAGQLAGAGAGSGVPDQPGNELRFAVTQSRDRSSEPPPLRPPIA